MLHRKVIFLRYPGGKQRQLFKFLHLLPTRNQIENRYIEPFLGGGAVFFCISPQKALLSDINQELINLYRGVRRYPTQVWQIFNEFPSTKDAYYKIRGWDPEELDLATRAARILYINRTCFKGMWRHNSNGEFNVGYGGQDRRWVISEENLKEVSRKLKRTSLKVWDFEDTIGTCDGGDFIFLDPPYRPGDREMLHHHYRLGKFSFEDQRRLAATLRRATGRGVRWAMTNSSHPKILSLYKKASITSLPKGTGRKIGQLVTDSGEVLIRNYRRV